MKDINPEAKQYYGENKIWGDNVGNNSTTKQHTVSCVGRGGVCGLAAKVHEVEAKHGEDGPWGGTNTQYWFESAKRHNMFTFDDVEWSDNSNTKLMLEGARWQSIDRPEYGNHRLDGQGITNVQVMCCDGFTSLAIDGDNDPYESQLARATYNVSKDDMVHLIGGLVATEERLQAGCDNMGGTWTGGACNDIPNDNPTGSWEQVNTMVLPVKGTYDDTNAVFNLKDGGVCCDKLKMGSPGKDDEEWIGGRKDDNFLAQWTKKLENNLNTIFSSTTGFAACPFTAIHAAMTGDKTACCSVETVKDGNGIDRTVMNIPAFPRIEKGDPDKCLTPETETKCEQQCETWVAETKDVKKCTEGFKEECNVATETCTKVVSAAAHAACGWMEDGWVKNTCYSGFDLVNQCEEIPCPKDEIKSVCKGWSTVAEETGEQLCDAYKTVCNVVETGACLLNEYTPELICQTQQVPLDVQFDLPVRFRRTARYAHKAPGHVNVIPGRWTPLYGCVDDKGTVVPLDNVIIGNNKQQRATDWRNTKNNSHNPGPIWHSTGWGDQLGISSLGFLCPEGTEYKRIGPSDAPLNDGTYTKGKREWDSAEAVGQQPNHLFLPEYRQAGMFSSWMSTGTPNLYTSCSNKPHSTQDEQIANIDDWENQCGWYFEGWRRRNNFFSKVDGDASTGGAWSEIDLGVWGRYLNPRDKCFDAQKNKPNDWFAKDNVPTTEYECTQQGGEWVDSSSPWGYNACVKSCLSNPVDIQSRYTE